MKFRYRFLDPPAITIIDAGADLLADMNGVYADYNLCQVGRDAARRSMRWNRLWWSVIQLSQGYEIWARCLPKGGLPIEGAMR